MTRTKVPLREGRDLIEGVQDLIYQLLADYPDEGGELRLDAYSLVLFRSVK
jgi:hypothetical protein